MKNKKSITGPDSSSTGRVISSIVRLMLTCVIAICLFLQIGSVYGQDAESPESNTESAKPLAPTKKDGPTYGISKVSLAYGLEDEQLPSVEALAESEIVLATTEAGEYVAWRLGMEQKRFTIATLPEGTYYASAVLLIAETVVADFQRRGYLGVTVGPDPTQFDSQGNDIRKGDKSITFIIRLAVVSNVRTLAAGGRVESDKRINNKVHQRLIADSPVRPKAEGETERNDFVNKGKLDQYIAFLNRHPGRRVDVSMSPGEEKFSVALDYLVSENRPWMIYYQLSNTGTEQTGEWRSRFGYVNNQFSNNDDVLNIDYITSGFDESNALVAGYEAPFSADNRTRFKVGTQYSEYTASDVGFANENFSGEEFILYGELICNTYQQDDFFLDLVGGLHFRSVHVNNDGFDINHTEYFINPYIGLRFEEKSQKSQLFGQLTIETLANTLTNPSRGSNGAESGKLDNLGRLYPDEGGTVIKWDLSYSFFLEPVLNREAWLDTSSPESSTLAHELAIGFKGQTVLNNQRMTPQFQRTAGGLYSVRGYEESLVAGDNAFLVSIEYRFHVPRAFGINPNPDETPFFGQPFRWAPQSVYGRPDWDLVLRSFVDYGRITNNDQERTFEDQHDLFGAGVGIEYLYKHNFSLRVDWGFALNDVKTGFNGNYNYLTTVGSSQVNIVATLIY